MFPSESLIEGGLYPKRGHLSPNSRGPRSDFLAGLDKRLRMDGMAHHWFGTYGQDHLSRVYVMEEYIPVLALETLLVLLMLDERDVFPRNDDNNRDDDCLAARTRPTTPTCLSEPSEGHQCRITPADGYSPEGRALARLSPPLPSCLNNQTTSIAPTTGIPYSGGSLVQPLMAILCNSGKPCCPE